MGLGGLIFIISFPIFLGYFVKHFGIFSASDITVLRKYVVKVTVPFIIFRNLYQADMSLVKQMVPGVVAMVIITGVFTLMAWGGRRIAGKDAPQANGFAVAVFVGNYGYLGWGVLHSFYGDTGFVRAIFFTMLFWPIFLFFGFLLVFLLSGENAARDGGFFRRALSVLMKNATVPVATVAGVLLVKWYSVPVPGPLVESINDISAVTIPTILFSIGLSFSLKVNLGALRTIISGCFFRLVGGIIPGIIAVAVVSLLFSPDTLMKKVILLESVMPTAAIAPFFTEYIDSDTTTVSTILTVSTLLSLVTLPLWFLIIEQYIG